MTPARRAARGLAVVLLALLAACGSDESEEEPRVQRIAYCQAPADDAVGGRVDVEFRQGSTVVARGLVDEGTAFAALVPLGGVQVYADGVQVGSANEGVPTDGPYTPPGPEDAVYLSSPEGCPERPVS